MSKRILVVEDQEDNRQILRDLLTSADFEVIEAEDGEAGLAAAATHRPDLILMDIQLPGLTAARPRVASEQMRRCRLFRLSPSPLMRRMGLRTRPVRPVASGDNEAAGRGESS